MDRVLIVAKTHMACGACVSGLTDSTNKGIRLLPPGHHNQQADTDFAVGQVWNMEFQELEIVEPPHVEDVIVKSQEYVGRVSNVRETLLKRVQPWKGEPKELFDGLLEFTANGKGFISRRKQLPKASTGYWLPDKPMYLEFDFKHKPFYSYLGSCTLPYVGYVDPIKQIPAQNLVRVSLARWWRPEGANEDRCYLQLSGWYL